MEYSIAEDNSPWAAASQAGTSSSTALYQDGDDSYHSRISTSHSQVDDTDNGVKGSPSPSQHYSVPDPKIHPQPHSDQSRFVTQTEPHTSSRNSASEAQLAPNPAFKLIPQCGDKPKSKLIVQVTGLERDDRQDLVVLFDVYTDIPTFRTTQFRDIRRTHAEFTRFAEHLISANPEAIVPAVPPHVTAAGAGTDEDDSKVRSNMQRWFNVICAHELLIADAETRLFVESDFGYSPVLRVKQAPTGVRRQVIKQFKPPPDPIIELADARPTVKMFYLESKNAGQKLDKVVEKRKALGTSESGFGTALASLSPQEHHPGLAKAFHKLGNVLRSVGDLHVAQGTFEASSLEDPLVYHSRDAQICKEILTNRQILMRDKISAEKWTRSKIQSVDRLRTSSSVKTDKADDAIASLESAREHEKSLSKKLEAVTRGLTHDRRLWVDRTVTDLKASVREYINRQIEAERRTLAQLESVRPDIRAIDASGGLSRLGRESHPRARRISLLSSQGPKGDAWSGVQRRSENSLTAGVAIPEVPDVTDQTGTPRVKGLIEEDDDDRVDARNAASRLAQTSF